MRHLIFLLVMALMLATVNVLAANKFLVTVFFLSFLPWIAAISLLVVAIVVAWKYL